MRLRTDHTQITSRPKAGLSVATGRRTESDSRPRAPKSSGGAIAPGPIRCGLWTRRSSRCCKPPRVCARSACSMNWRGASRSYRPSFGARWSGACEWKALHGADRRHVPPDPAARPYGCPIHDVTISASASAASASNTGCIISRWPAPASNTSRSCSAARATQPWRAAWRMHCPAWRRATEQPQATALGGIRNLTKPDADDLTKAFRTLIIHFGMVPSRNNRCCARERCIESRTPRQEAPRQALLLRGSACFDDLDAYRAFAADVVAQHNRRHAS